MSIQPTIRKMTKPAASRESRTICRELGPDPYAWREARGSWLSLVMEPTGREPAPVQTWLRDCLPERTNR